MHCICNAIVRYLTELTVNQDESKAKRANLCCEIFGPITTRCQANLKTAL